jgi:hypothetical protein
MSSHFREVLIVFAVTCVSIAALVVAGSIGWRGTLDTCVVGDQCFCERDRGGLIRTPANTLSNFGFVAAGFGIAAILGVERRRGRHPRRGNPMTETDFYPGFYACIVAFLGPASMALHGSLMSWGGVIDIVSMNFFIGFVLMYALQRLYGFGRSTFMAGWLAINAVLLALKLTIGRGSEAFGVVAVLALVVELRIRATQPVEAAGRWLVACAGCFLLAFAIWLASRNGGPLCSPESLWQGHAAWHFLCAAATLALYQYARSEKRAAEELNG